jgi:hypothetical protein
VVWREISSGEAVFEGFLACFREKVVVLTILWAYCVPAIPHRRKAILDKS